MRFYPLLLFCAPAYAAAPPKNEAAKEESKAVAEAATDADDAALTVGERDSAKASGSLMRIVMSNYVKAVNQLIVRWVTGMRGVRASARVCRSAIV